MKKEFNFTKRTLDTLKVPAKGKRDYFYDTKSRGLIIMITGNGTKTFYLYRKIHGLPERIWIGLYPDMSIENARGKASTLNAAIANGENPQDFNRDAKSELTLEKLFKDYLEKHAKPYKRTWEGDEYNFNKYLAKWKHRKLSQIRKKDIQSFHAKLGKDSGPYTANRVLALLRILFNKAIEWGEFDKANPMIGIKKFPEKSRSRFIQADELPRFFKALSEEPNDTIRDYFLISLLTGARRGNVLTMQWDEINFDSAVWTIPETKAGHEHEVPLTNEALEILRNRQKKSKSHFVFPGTGKSGHLGQQHKSWKRILKRAGIKDLRIHDLRRTLGSWQAATGASLSIIGKTLDHSNVSTTAIYARLNLDPVRQSLETATNAMLTAGGLREEAEVIPIRKGK